MKLAGEFVAVVLILAVLLAVWSPGTALEVVFLVILWAAWRRRPRRSGVRQ